MSGHDYDLFVLSFRKTFLAPADVWDFMDAWRVSVMGFDLDVLQSAISATAADIRVLKTPARFYLPIILDYAGEMQERKQRAIEAERRRRDDDAYRAKIAAERKAGVVHPSFVEAFAARRKAVQG